MEQQQRTESFTKFHYSTGFPVCIILVAISELMLYYRSLSDTKQDNQKAFFKDFF